MTRQRGGDPRGVAERSGRLSHDRTRLAVGIQSVVPLGIRRGRDAGGSRCVGPPARSNLLAAPQHLARLSGRAHHARLRQLRERIRQPFRIGVIVAIGRSLQTARILDALLRLVGANHPGARLSSSSSSGASRGARTAPHLGHARSAGPGAAPHRPRFSAGRRALIGCEAASTWPQYHTGATGRYRRPARSRADLRPGPGERVLGRGVAARAERRRQGIGGEKARTCSFDVASGVGRVRPRRSSRARAHARPPARAPALVPRRQSSDRSRPLRRAGTSPASRDSRSARTRAACRAPAAPPARTASSR